MAVLAAVISTNITAKEVFDFSIFNVILLAFIWVAWCSLHSLLISRWAHDAADKVLGSSAGVYRLIYVLFSCVSLVPVLWYQFSLPQHPLIPPGMPIRIFQGILLLYAFVLFYLGAKAYNMGYFLGITQWQQKGTRPVKLTFHTTGILENVRHPWYSAGIAFVWGLGSITDIYLLTRIILTGYFIIGTLLEENRLRTEFGEQYTEYCRKVPMLIPRLRRK